MGSVEHVLSAGTIEEDDDKLGQAVTHMALTSLKRLVGRQAEPGCRLACRRLRRCKYGQPLHEHGQETFHAIHVEASSSFSLALRISLLAAARPQNVLRCAHAAIASVELVQPEHAVDSVQLGRLDGFRVCNGNCEQGSFE